MRMARDISNHDLAESDFASRAEALISQYPELQSITWIDSQRRILASQSAPTVSSDQLRIPREVLRAGDALEAYQLARDGHRPVVFEADDRVGGMTACFDFSGLEIERYYHFHCTSDTAFLQVLDEPEQDSNL